MKGSEPKQAAFSLSFTARLANNAIADGALPTSSVLVEDCGLTPEEASVALTIARRAITALEFQAINFGIDHYGNLLDGEGKVIQPVGKWVEGQGFVDGQGNPVSPGSLTPEELAALRSPDQFK